MKHSRELIAYALGLDSPSDLALCTWEDVADNWNDTFGGSGSEATGRAAIRLDDGGATVTVEASGCSGSLTVQYAAIMERARERLKEAIHDAFAEVVGELLYEAVADLEPDQTLDDLDGRLVPIDL